MEILTRSGDEVGKESEPGSNALTPPYLVEDTLTGSVPDSVRISSILSPATPVEEAGIPTEELATTRGNITLDNIYLSSETIPFAIDDEIRNGGGGNDDYLSMNNVDDEGVAITSQHGQHLMNISNEQHHCPAPTSDQNGKDKYSKDDIRHYSLGGRGLSTIESSETTSMGDTTMYMRLCDGNKSMNEVDSHVMEPGGTIEDGNTHGGGNNVSQSSGGITENEASWNVEQ